MLATQKGRSNPVRISCRRSEKLKCGSLKTALDPNPSAYFFGREPRDTDNFLAAGLAGGNGNGRSRHHQKFREEFDAGLVGAAIDGWRGQREFERVAEFAGDGIFPGARVDLDCEGYAAGRFLKGNQSFSPKENAVSASKSAPASKTCGCCSVRAFPMLATSAITSTSIVTFAVRQNSFKPFTARPLRMRRTFSMAVNNRARHVPKIQILPV